MKGIKFSQTLKITFVKSTFDDDKPVFTYKTAFFNTKSITIINVDEISLSVKQAHEAIINIVDEWLSEGSGWAIDEINAHFLNIVKYQPLKTKSFIKLPQELQNRKGL